MSDWILYLMKSTSLLTVFFAFFLLVMRRSSFFRFNRFALLGGAAICLLLPLIPLRIGTPNLYAVLVAASVIGDGGMAADQVVEGPARAGLGWTEILMLLYLAGAATVLVLNLISCLRLVRLLHATPWQPKDGCRLHLLEKDAP